MSSLTIKFLVGPGMTAQTPGLLRCLSCAQSQDPVGRYSHALINCRDTSLRPTQNQCMGIVSAFVGIECFQIHHMANHVKFVKDAIAAMHVDQLFLYELIDGERSPELYAVEGVLPHSLPTEFRRRPGDATTRPVEATEWALQTNCIG